MLQRYGCYASGRLGQQFSRAAPLHYHHCPSSGWSLQCSASGGRSMCLYWHDGKSNDNNNVLTILFSYKCSSRKLSNQESAKYRERKTSKKKKRIMGI